MLDDLRIFTRLAWTDKSSRPSRPPRPMRYTRPERVRPREQARKATKAEILEWFGKGAR